MRNHRITFFTLALLSSFCIGAFGQERIAPASFPHSNRFTLGGGVSQIPLGGFNVQAEYNH